MNQKLIQLLIQITRSHFRKNSLFSLIRCMKILLIFETFGSTTLIQKVLDHKLTLVSVIGCIASVAGIICLSLPLPAVVQNFHKVHALESHRKFSERIFTQLKVNRLVKGRLITGVVESKVDLIKPGQEQVWYFRQN